MLVICEVVIIFWLEYFLSYLAEIGTSPTDAR
jgi:hypothetical protein